jgi:hypothetical protein
MKYDVEFKCFGYVSARNPRQAQKITRNALREVNVFLIEPTFKVKHEWKEKEAKK